MNSPFEITPIPHLLDYKRYSLSIKIRVGRAKLYTAEFEFHVLTSNDDLFISLVSAAKKSITLAEKRKRKDNYIVTMI